MCAIPLQLFLWIKLYIPVADVMEQQINQSLSMLRMIPVQMLKDVGAYQELSATQSLYVISSSS